MTGSLTSPPGIAGSALGGEALARREYIVVSRGRYQEGASPKATEPDAVAGFVCVLCLIFTANPCRVPRSGGTLGESNKTPELLGVQEPEIYWLWDPRRFGDLTRQRQEPQAHPERGRSPGTERRGGQTHAQSPQGKKRRPMGSNEGWKPESLVSS